MMTKLVAYLSDLFLKEDTRGIGICGKLIGSSSYGLAQYHDTLDISLFHPYITYTSAQISDYFTFFVSHLPKELTPGLITTNIGACLQFQFPYSLLCECYPKVSTPTRCLVNVYFQSTIAVETSALILHYLDNFPCTKQFCILMRYWYEKHTLLSPPYTITKPKSPLSNTTEYIIQRSIEQGFTH